MSEPYIASFGIELRLYMHIPDGGNKMPTIVGENQGQISERIGAVPELDASETPVLSGYCGGTSCCGGDACCCDDTSCCGDNVSRNISGTVPIFAV